VALSHDVHRRFPGETDADVEELCRFVDDQRFEHVGVFHYSTKKAPSAFG